MLPADPTRRGVPRPAPAQPARGFTLVEVLLVLALILLTGAVLLPVAGAFMKQVKQESPDQMIAQVLQEVRRDAILAGRPVTLRFDADTQHFMWDAGQAGTRAASGPKLRVDFLRPVTNGAVLIGGNLVETGAVPTLTFYPDGTCDPVRVQLRPATGAARVVTVDPWTCATGLEVPS